MLIAAFVAGNGTFVVGDKSAAKSPPDHVTLFSEAWKAHDELSGQYKAKEFDGNAQNGALACGATWTTQVDSNSEESDSGKSNGDDNGTGDDGPPITGVIVSMVC